MGARAHEFPPPETGIGRKGERKTSDSSLGQILLIDKARIMCPMQQREAGNANSWHAESQARELSEQGQWVQS